MVSHC